MRLSTSVLQLWYLSHVNNIYLPTHITSSHHPTSTLHLSLNHSPQEHCQQATVCDAFNCSVGCSSKFGTSPPWWPLPNQLCNQAGVLLNQVRVFRCPLPRLPTDRLQINITLQKQFLRTRGRNPLGLTPFLASHPSTIHP